MVAISRIYNNITFEELGNILEISAIKAEQIVANMVAETRITATLDQKNSIIEFHNENEALTAWDQNIATLCQAIDKIVGDLK
jgi:COP9 signalosome complex subunit 4